MSVSFFSSTSFPQMDSVLTEFLIFNFLNYAGVEYALLLGGGPKL